MSHEEQVQMPLDIHPLPDSVSAYVRGVIVNCNTFPNISSLYIHSLWNHISLPSRLTGKPPCKLTQRTVPAFYKHEQNASRWKRGNEKRLERGENRRKRTNGERH